MTMNQDPPESRQLSSVLARLAFAPIAAIVGGVMFLSSTIVAHRQGLRRRSKLRQAGRLITWRELERSHNLATGTLVYELRESFGPSLDGPLLGGTPRRSGVVWWVPERMSAASPPLSPAGRHYDIRGTGIDDMPRYDIWVAQWLGDEEHGRGVLIDAAIGSAAQQRLCTKAEAWAKKANVEFVWFLRWPTDWFATPSSKSRA
jgi:hypothetical protein